MLYTGLLAVALSVIAFGLMTAIQASAGLSQATPQDKTLLELQVESSRDIRRALAAPIVIPPLPPVTARLARSITAVTAQRKPAPSISQEARDAMAMDQSAAMGQGAARFNYPVFDGTPHPLSRQATSSGANRQAEARPSSADRRTF